MFGHMHLVLLDSSIDTSMIKIADNFKWQHSKFIKALSIREK